VIDSDILKRVDEISKQAVTSGIEIVSGRLQFAYWITITNKDMVRFDQIDSLINYIESEPIKVESISLQYIVRDQAGISLAFQQKGKIELSAYSNTLDFQFNIDQLTREIQRSDQEYNWFVRTFVFHSQTRRLLTSLFLLLSLGLLMNISYYVYALKVGVNIDPQLIPSGNSYFQEVEAAIKSDDASRKLNVLLLSQLRGFTNVQDILRRKEQIVVFLLTALVITLIFLWGLISVTRIYPASFFAFGDQKKILVKLHRKRDIWAVAVVIGLIVNVLAGIIVALVARTSGFGL
jgi:hypothetical protein